MNLLAALENGLFALGQVLRFPVMALLWVCVAAAVFLAAACLVESLARRRERRGFNVSAWLKNGSALDAAEAGGRPHLRRGTGREYLWGWDATAPDVIDDAKWQETFDVYVEDKHKLGTGRLLRQEFAVCVPGHDGADGGDGPQGVLEGGRRYAEDSSSRNTSTA